MNHPAITVRQHPKISRFSVVAAVAIWLVALLPIAAVLVAMFFSTGSSPAKKSLAAPAMPTTAQPATERAKNIRPLPQMGRETVRPEFLQDLIPPNVENLRCEFDPYGGLHISYLVDEVFPCPSYIPFLVGTLATHGYQPQPYDRLNPGTPSNLRRGWDSRPFTIHGDPLRHWRWKTWFQDDEGSTVSVMLSYQSPDHHTRHLKKLGVNLTYEQVK